MTKTVSCEGYSYRFDPTACSRCGGRCCNGESGLVRTTPEEAANMAAALGMDVADFTARYLAVRHGMLSVQEIRDNDNYACALYRNDPPGCTVYDARPLQCRTFPFWPGWQNRLRDLARECPGVILPGEPALPR